MDTSDAKLRGLVEATLLCLPLALLLTVYQGIGVLYLVVFSVATTYLFYLYRIKWFSFIVLSLVSVYVLLVYDSFTGLVLLTYLALVSIAIPYAPIKYRSFRDIVPPLLVALYTVLFLYLFTEVARKHPAIPVLAEALDNPGGLLVAYLLGLIYASNLASKIYRWEVELERAELLGVLSRYSPWRVFHLVVYSISLYLVYKDIIYLVPLSIGYFAKIIVDSIVRIGDKSIVVFIIVFYIVSLILGVA